MGGRVCFWGCCGEPAGLHVLGTKNTRSDSHPPRAARRMPHTQPPPEDSVCWGGAHAGAETGTPTRGLSVLGWGTRWSRDGHPRLGETLETRPAGQSGPSSGEAVNGIKSCFSVASGTRPRAASRGHRHDVLGRRGPCQGHRPAAACLPREAARGRAAPSGQAETQGRVTDPHRPRHPCLPRPHLGTTCQGPRLAQTLCIPSRAQGAHSKAPRAHRPSRVFGRARASGVGRAAPSVRAKPCVQRRNQQPLWTRLPQLGLLIASGDTGRLEAWVDSAGSRWLGLWGCRPQGTHTVEGIGLGSRPGEASGSSTLLRSGTRHARVMHGVAWGCTGSFQRAEGCPAGVPSEEQQASG